MVACDTPSANPENCCRQGVTVNQSQHVWLVRETEAAFEACQSNPALSCCTCTLCRIASCTLQLVQRFYDPQQGSVLLEGVALPQIDNVYLHQSVALVAQEPLVFANTIKANILFGVHRTNVTQVRP